MKYIRRKLQRWALKLGSFNYIIEHLSCESNVWADVVSKSHREPSKDVVKVRHIMAGHNITLSPLRPLQDENFVWPNEEQILGS